MPPKRKSEQSGEEAGPTGRQKKKVKMAAARTIAVQPMAASKSVHVNAEAGPSNANRNASGNVNGKGPTLDSLKGLPSFIDVEKFTEARSYEINAMHTGMKAARASATTRAWQLLPRHLRRRAASHDVRRVPLRLREKARAEMDPVRKKALNRMMKPKRGRANQIPRTQALLKRQRDKTWLETHIWHAKRMHMENMWGYRLATHPTEKAYRPSHRASMHGAILHDASYHSVIELKSAENVLRTLLEICCDPQGPGAKRYISGARTYETHIYNPGSYPFGLVAPITVLWKPLPPPIDEHDTPSQKGTQKATIKGKSKTKSKVSEDSDKPLEPIRTIWVRSHPSVFDLVFNALKDTASITLDAVRLAREKQNKATAEKQKPSQQKGKGKGKSTQDVQEDASIEIADLRGAVNVFEIMGPKASQVIRGALVPVAADTRPEFKQFWNSLTDLQTTASVPRGTVIGFKVNDPRLSFPPSNAKPRTDEAGNLTPPDQTFPSAALAQSEIWEDKERESLRKPKYKKADIDERKSKLLVPGTKLPALRQDDRIPILLIQRSVEQETTGTGNNTSTTTHQGIHGWTVIIPAGWSMPFFSSLTHTGTRVGGQRERQTQSFEAGCVMFPRDYAGTSAYGVYAEERAVKERERWERTPPAKRTNFDKLGSRSPWAADWEVVLGLQSAKKDGIHVDDGGEFVSTQREGNEGVVVVVDAAKNKVEPWLLRGVEVTAILARIAGAPDRPAALLGELNRLRLKRLQHSLEIGVTTDEDIWRSALVNVRVKLCARGSPDDMAIIYSITDEECRLWDGAREGSFLNPEYRDEDQLADNKPNPDLVIGYVTTGHFSLSRGEGFAVGAISLFRLFELHAQNKRLHPEQVRQDTFPPLMVVVRNADSLKSRAAYIHVVY